MYFVILFTILNINGIFLRVSPSVLRAGVAEGSGQHPGARKILPGIVDDEDSRGSGMPPLPSEPLGSGDVPTGVDFRSRPTGPTVVTPIIVLPATGTFNRSATATSASSILSHTLIYHHPGQTMDPSKMGKKLDLNDLTSSPYGPIAGPGVTYRMTSPATSPAKTSHAAPTSQPTTVTSRAPTYRPPGDEVISNDVGSILGPKEDQRRRAKGSFFSRPEVLATAIGGACMMLLCAILLILFIVYRLRKKDEGSYALDETKRALASHGSAGGQPPPPYGMGSLGVGGAAQSPYSRGGRGPPPVNMALLNKEFYA